MSLSGATALFALFLGALVWAAEIAPPVKVSSVAAPPIKETRLAAPVVSKCALETWPNITTDCLRHAGAGQQLGEARLIVAGQP